MSTNPLQFTEHSGVVAPLDKANVDTDQIIPKQFLKSIKRTGFGENLFDAWRFKDEGFIGKTLTERTLDESFVLNDPRYVDASILVARENFACGSSREHAVWALLQYGFRCVIAPSFADIFYNNCFNNGLLPIELNHSQVDRLFSLATKSTPLSVSVHLQEQFISISDDEKLEFEIDSQRKTRMLRGLDDIGSTLEYSDQIRDFEKMHAVKQPWLFSESGS